MNVSKKYLRSSVLALCIAGAGFTVATVFPSTAAVAADEKKVDKGEKIALDQLPKAVVDAVKRDMPGSKLTKASKKSEEGKTIYFLDDVKVGKKEWDLKVAEDGKILHKEECHDD